jgi:hypothetical protein
LGGYGTGLENLGQWFLDPSSYLGYKQNPHIGHKHHLCAMAESGEVTVEQMKELIRDAKFMCKICGRSALNSENLCEPEPL